VTLVDKDGAPAVPAQNGRVAICIPSQDLVHALFMHDVVNLVAHTMMARPDLSLSLLNMRGTLIADQRHNLVVNALGRGATHILWLDADMRFPKDALVRLLAHGEPIVAASYISRRAPLRPVSEISGRGDVVPGPQAFGLLEVSRTGMGVMLTATTCFNPAQVPWFAIGFSPKTGVYTGEDVFFCRQMKAAGIPVLIDLGLSNEIGHLGEFEYTHDVLRAEIAARDDLEQTEAPAAPAEPPVDGPHHTH
jgi:hypothetical protein